MPNGSRDRIDMAVIRRQRREVESRRRETAWLSFLVAAAVILLCCSKVKAEDSWTWDARSLLAKYNCEWINDMRKTHTDDELVAKAREMRLPSWLIERAKRCKR